MQNCKVPAETLGPGDVIRPPARELSGWMRRRAAEHQLDETALCMTVSSVREGPADSGGRWTLITARMSSAWCAATGSRPYDWTFRARPNTPWPLITREERALAPEMGMAALAAPSPKPGMER